MRQHTRHIEFVPPPTRVKCYKIGPRLGAGAFAEVYEAVKDGSGEKFAIKVFPKSNLKDQNDILRFQREIDAMAYLRNDNVVAMFDFFWDSANFYLVMDNCSGGELFSYIAEQGKLSEPIAALLFKQIVGGVAFCHSFGVAHRDLKPENILIADFPVIKVADFGLCAYVREERLMESFCGSPCYCSPECLCRVQYDGRLSDIWSLGVILYVMVTGEHPWTVHNTSLMLRQIMKAHYTVPSYTSPECLNLIEGLLKIRPGDRMSMEAIMKHPWLKFSDWALVATPPNINEALNTMRLAQPMTLEQISSSSSRSSHRSEGGIVCPFDDSYQNLEDDEEHSDEERIMLGSLRGQNHTISASMESLFMAARRGGGSMQRDPNPVVSRITGLRRGSSSSLRAGNLKKYLCVPHVRKCEYMHAITEEAG